ncbi:MAG: anion permease [Halobacteriota archaeon]|uniref:inorganic phosphate transporter n=1 Tax=Natronomonas sp. TaxID=2184060 RepID=UPI003974E75C
MLDPLLVGGVLIACFVAYNIGGATTGPAFGPAVGAGVIGKTVAGALMSVFFFLGAFTIGRRVVETIGTDLVRDPAVFTLPASIVVLFFIGGALLVGNVSGAPSSTSMTAVGAIAGLGLAAGELDSAVVAEILAWWILSPVIGFWIAVMIGRYYYERLDRIVALERSEGPLVTIDRTDLVPRPERGPNTTRREVFGTATVIAIGCVMAFSSGTSNIANAVAPLVGSGAVGMNVGIVVGSIAVTVGAVTIARRTMETLGNDITDLPLTAAIIVAILSSTITILLSAVGIPASFVIIATVCIVGLGWGRSTQGMAITDAVRGNASARVSVGALSAEGASTVSEPAVNGSGNDVGPDRSNHPSRSDLFDPGTTVRIIVMQNVVPILATVGSYLVFASVGPL